MIVATAGHIDHGKTTLVKLLTGVDTDRLPEEKARGISIDLGFAYWRTPGDQDTVAFVDVPGHERFVRNMLAGVCGIDYVMLVVAADDGVMPQTIEHLNIVELLSIRCGIAVITKIDRVSKQRAEDVTRDLRKLLASTGLASIDVMQISATSGEGMTRLRTALGAAARALARKGQEGKSFRLAVDRVFSVAGSGTVVTGTVFSGSLAVGSKLVVSPIGIEVRVRGIQKDGKAAVQVSAGERCALNLVGIDYADAVRGDWVLAPSLHAPTQRIDVRLRLLDSEIRILKHWTPVHLHHGACDVTARISIPRGASAMPGADALAQLIVDKPLAALNGDRFIIRDQSARRTLGGGIVIDPAPPRHRRHSEQRIAQLAALENTDAGKALTALQACSPAGIELSWFGRIYNVDDAHLARLVSRNELVVIGRQPPIALPRAIVGTISGKVVHLLERFHREHPQAAGIDISDLRKQLAPGQADATFAALMRLVAESKAIEFTGSVARLPRHVTTDNPADEAIWQAVQPPLGAAGFRGLTLVELAHAASIKTSPLKDFMHRKAKTPEVVAVTPERFYLRSTLAQFVEILVRLSREAPGGRFSVAQIRDRAGVGRNRVIEILECLDRLEITQRTGEQRVMRKVGTFA